MSKLPKYFQAHVFWFDWSIKLALNTIGNGELSDPLCDRINRGLTLVRLVRQLWCLVFFFSNEPLSKETINNKQTNKLFFYIGRELLFVIFQVV